MEATHGLLGELGFEIDAYAPVDVARMSDTSNILVLPTSDAPPDSNFAKTIAQRRERNREAAKLSRERVKARLQSLVDREAEWDSLLSLLSRDCEEESAWLREAIRKASSPKDARVLASLASKIHAIAEFPDHDA